MLRMREMSHARTGSPRMEIVPLSRLLPHLRRLRDKPLEFLLELGRWSPRAFLRLPGMPLAVVFDPAGVEKVLLNAELSKDTFQYRALARLTGRGLLTDWGESWRQARQQLKEPFLPKAVQGYREAMLEEIERFFDHWDAGPRDLDHEMMALSLRLLGRAIFGGPLPERLAQLTLQALEWVIAQTQSPWAFLNLLGALRFRRTRAQLYRAAEGLSQLPPLSGLPRERALSEAVTLIVAGHETVASSLSFALLLLSHHPEWQERVAHCYEDAVAVYNEALRLFPPAWILTRKVEQPYRLGDFTLPRGTTVVLSPYVTQRLYFPEGDRFDPERFLLHERATPSGRYFPFGLGKRLCIGRDLSLLEGPLVLSTFFRRFRLEPIPPPRILARVTLRPHGGLWATPQRVLR